MTLTHVCKSPAQAQPATTRPTSPGAPTTPVTPPGSTVSAVTFDTSDLTPMLKKHSLPTALLPASAFSTEAIGSRLIGTRFRKTPTRGPIQSYVAPGWHLTLVPSRGSLLVTSFESGEKSLAAESTAVRNSDPPPPAAPAGPAIPRDDLEIIRRWGVPDGEILRTARARGMAQDADGQNLQAATVFRVKTFAIRGIDGIPVRGHRIVLSRDPGGRLSRVLAVWPPLAPSGHVLSTRLTVTQIMSRARAALAKEGIRSGRSQLTLEYVPTVNASGTAALRLRGVARVIGSSQNSEFGDETRVIDFDVTS